MFSGSSDYSIIPSFHEFRGCTLGVMRERALTSTSRAVLSFSVWGGWGSGLGWTAGTVSTLKRGCQRVSLSSGTDTGGTKEERKTCRHRGGFNTDRERPSLWAQVIYYFKQGFKDTICSSSPYDAVWLWRPDSGERCVVCRGDEKLIGQDGHRSVLWLVRHVGKLSAPTKRPAIQHSLQFRHPDTLS